MRERLGMALFVLESRCGNMKKTFYRHVLACLFAVLLGLLCTGAAYADNIFVTNFFDSTIGEYTTSGAAVNASLISGLNNPVGIAVSGSNLFVANLWQ